MTDKEALEYLLLFDATWYIVVFAFVMGMSRSLWDFVMSRLRKEDELEIRRLEDELFTLKRQLDYLLRD